VKDGQTANLHDVQGESERAVAGRGRGLSGIACGFNSHRPHHSFLSLVNGTLTIT